jgi:hypothetical protein
MSWELQVLAGTKGHHFPAVLSQRGEADVNREALEILLTPTLSAPTRPLLLCAIPLHHRNV